MPRYLVFAQNRMHRTYRERERENRIFAIYLLMQSTLYARITRKMNTLAQEWKSKKKNTNENATSWQMPNNRPPVLGYTNKKHPISCVLLYSIGIIMFDNILLL